MNAQGNDLNFSHGADRSAHYGDSVSIPLIAQGVENINSMQFTIHWNPHVMEFLSITGLDTTAGFSMSDIGTGETVEGRIYFVFVDPIGMGASLNDGDTLMNVNLRMSGRPGSQSMFGLQSFPVQLQAFGGGNFKNFEESRIDVTCQEPQFLGRYQSVCSEGQGSDLSKYNVDIFGNTYPAQFLFRDTASQDTLANVWVRSDTSIILADLPEDVYVAEFRDADTLLKYTDTLNIEPKDPLTAQFSTNDGSCPQIADGDIFLQEISGGLGAFTVIWPDGTLHYRSLPDVRPGLYDIVIIDAEKCADTFEVEVEGPEAIVREEIRNASCPGVANGRVIADVLNLPRFSDSTLLFSLNGTNFFADVNFKSFSIPPGPFRYYIQDTTGCIFEKETFVLSDNEIFVQGVTQTDPSCQGVSDGAVSLIAALRTEVDGDFNFQWSGHNSTTNDSAFTATDLSDGSYQLTITHSGLNSGCELVREYMIDEPDSLLIVGDTLIDESCFAENNGFISVHGEGGSQPYEYSWSNGDSISTLSALSPGSYELSLTDRNNCTEIDTFVIDTGLQVNFSEIEVKDVDCHAGNDGQIKVHIDSSYGTITPLFYKVNPLMESAVELKTDSFVRGSISAGSIEVIVRDSLGCGADTTIVITQPNPIEIFQTDSLIPDCETSNGAISVSAIGGTGDFYNYSWSSGSDSSTATGLFPGTYTLTVEDENNCQGIDSFQMTPPQPPQLEYTTIVDVECFGLEDGFIALEVSEGSAPIKEISWNTGDTGLILDELAAGIYSITVTDEKNCRLIDDFVVQQPDSIEINFEIIHDTTGTGMGVAAAIVNGGIPPYTYVWNTSPIQTDSIAEGLTQGRYQVLVRDDNECTATKMVEIFMTVSTTIAQLPLLKVYPNPATSWVYITQTNEGVASPTLLIVRSADGKIVQSRAWEKGTNTQRVYFGSSGIYYLEVIYGEDGHREQIPVVIQQ
jgi:hypothetical protein